MLTRWLQRSMLIRSYAAPVGGTLPVSPIDRPPCHFFPFFLGTQENSQKGAHPVKAGSLPGCLDRGCFLLARSEVPKKKEKKTFAITVSAAAAACLHTTGQVTRGVLSTSLVGSLALLRGGRR